MALRTSLVAQPHLYMGDVTGKPLDYGMVYFGQPNKDPEFYPIDIYYDESLTVAAAQPVRTKGGFLNANGQMVEIYAVETIYSVKALDAYGREVFYQTEMSSASTSTSVNTRLPYPGAVTRTVAEKTSDSVSPMDFGAKGDSITDDTAAFELLESNVTGREIDLQNKVYAVNETPDSNTYINGSFTVNAQKVPANGKAFDAPISSLPLVAAVNDGMSGLIWDWLITTSNLAGGDANTVQSFALDEKNRRIYCIYGTSNFGGSGVLHAMPMDRGTGFSEALWAADADVRIGHQGLALENNRNGGSYIWTSKGFNAAYPETNDPNCGQKCIRFRVDNVPDYRIGASNAWADRNGLYFENVEVYQLWETHNSIQSSQPTLSYDQKYLITKKNATGGGYRIRIFELATLVAGGSGDYSKKYIQEFSVDHLDNNPETGVELQDLACDGNFIYFYSGRGLMTDGDEITIVIYDMYGNHVRSVTHGDLGVYDSINYKPDPANPNTHMETEGISIASLNGSPQLLVHFAGGTEGKRTQLIYALGLKQGNFRGDRNTAAMMLDNQQGGLSLAFPNPRINSKYNTIGTVYPEGVTRPNIQIGNDSRLYLGRGLNAPLPMLNVSSGGAPALNFTDNTLQYVGGDSATPMRSVIFKSRAPNIANYTQKALQNGDYIYELSITGDDGTKKLDVSGVGVQCAAISFRVMGDVSAGVVPTNVQFATSSVDGIKNLRFEVSRDGHFVPFTTNKYDIASASMTLRNIYIANSPIVSSDERLKQNFRKLKAAEKKAAIEIKESICLYKMKDAVAEKGDGARWHVGVRAQQIVSIMESHKLKPFDYGFICHDTWGAQNAELDEEGNEVQAAREAGDKYAVRYDELAMFILAAI